MLSNFELEDLSTHYGFDLIITMKDELVNYKPINGNYIINLESSSEGNGTHWLALKIVEKHCMYFDSYGMLPPQEIITFCKRIRQSRLAYNTLEIQNIKAVTCGWFAAAFLIHLNHTQKEDLYKSANDFFQLFSKNTLQNNKVLQQYYRQLPNSKGFVFLQKLYKEK